MNSKNVVLSVVASISFLGVPALAVDGGPCSYEQLAAATRPLARKPCLAEYTTGTVGGGCRHDLILPSDFASSVGSCTDSVTHMFDDGAGGDGGSYTVEVKAIGVVDGKCIVTQRCLQ